MKRIGLMVFCVIGVLGGPGMFGPSALGQSASGPVRHDTMHLTVLTSISDTEVAPGQRVSLAFAVTPKKLMHVYAPGKHEYQVIAVKLDPQPWFRVQPTTYPPSEIYHFEVLDERVETYGKPFKLVQDVTILSTPEARKLLAASPTVKLSGRLEYQACDDRVCYAPTRVPVSFTLTVKDPDAK
ncbi:MAG: protein-disulfide reductase DsbD family protein [Acidobacteriota bacterium]|nr:protein-disulfide reductase DsbD family protein [Acidobacteriota bacterium]